MSTVTRMRRRLPLAIIRSPQSEVSAANFDDNVVADTVAFKLIVETEIPNPNSKLCCYPSSSVRPDPFCVSSAPSFPFPFAAAAAAATAIMPLG